ncbi:hypothetical protein BJ741DRAFT_613637, partial [Chytriomyces cf. hyalinus JEL632]
FYLLVPSTSASMFSVLLTSMPLSARNASILLSTSSARVSSAPRASKVESICAISILSCSESSPSRSPAASISASFLAR